MFGLGLFCVILYNTDHSELTIALGLSSFILSALTLENNRSEESVKNGKE